MAVKLQNSEGKKLLNKIHLPLSKQLRDHAGHEIEIFVLSGKQISFDDEMKSEP